MHPTRVRRAKDHKCGLTFDSQSALPHLSPKSSILSRIHRQIKKLFLVSSRHYLTHSYFKSKSSLLAERKRHIKTAPWYVIHPFSDLAIFIEIYMTIVWALDGLLDPLYYAFIQTNFLITRQYMLIIELSELCYIGISFIFGYINDSNTEIILRKRDIAIHYLGSYFVFDLFGSLSILLFVHWTMSINRPQSLTLLLKFLKMLKVVRLKTMLNYSGQITNMIRLGDTAHKIMCLVVTFIYLLHWSTCVLYAVPMILSGQNGFMYQESWVTTADVINKSAGWK